MSKPEMGNSAFGGASEAKESRETLVKVSDYVGVPVYAGDSAESILAANPGYVVYDRKKHDVSGLKRRQEKMTNAMPMSFCEIVKE